ncbi:MAG TPA: hypothetical protein VJU84_01580 [Pyrinomonadaceae bacterium]|nr:hypothetical protein [Pyrinomonadaceae bacterium]
MRGYEKTTSPRRAIHKELEDIEKLIGAAPAGSEQPHTNSQKYPGFSKASFHEAFEKYREGFETK